MTVAHLLDLCLAVAPTHRGMPVLFCVPALPLEAGDKLATVAAFDVDGSLVIEVDTSNVELVATPPGERGGDG